MTAVLDFLKSVDVEKLSPAEAQEYLRVLGSWQQKIAGVGAVSTPAPTPFVRKVESPRAVGRPAAPPSVAQLAANAVPHGPGDFKNISIRYKHAFGVILSHGKLAKKAYAAACIEHGEDAVLAAFDSWAPGNGWVRDKGHTSALYQLYEALPSILAADKLVQADETKVQVDKAKAEAATADAIESGRGAELLAKIRRLEKKKAEEAAEKFSEENPEILFS